MPVLFFLASYNIMLCVASSIFLSEKENIIFEILVISVATAQFKSNRLYNHVCFYASYPAFSLFLTRCRLRSEGSPTMPSIFKGFESGSCCLFIGWLAVSFSKPKFHQCVFRNTVSSQERELICLDLSWIRRQSD